MEGGWKWERQTPLSPPPPPQAFTARLPFTNFVIYKFCGRLDKSEGSAPTLHGKLKDLRGRFAFSHFNLSS